MAGSTFAALWRMLQTAQRREVVLAQAVSLTMALTTVAGIAAISPFFAVLAEPDLIGRSPCLRTLYAAGGFASPQAFEAALGCAFILMALISNAVNFFGAYYLQRIAFGIGNDMKSRLLQEYLRRDLLFHSRTHSAELINNIIFEAVRGPIGMLQSLFQAVTGAATALAIVASMLVVNSLAAMAVGAALIGGYGLLYAAIRKRITYAAREERALVAEQMKLVGEALGAIKQVLVMRRQGYFQQRFDLTCGRLARLAARNDAITNSPRQIMECLAVAVLVSSCLMLSSEHEGTGAWLPRLSFLGFSVYRLLPALQQSFASLVRLRGAEAGFSLIAPDLARTHQPVTAPFPPAAQTPSAPRIELQGVSFAYESGRCALDSVDVVLPARAIVGIIGDNGSGKTTLMDLVAGLLTPDQGRILIDGADLSTLSLKDWQSMIAYVPQQTFLLDRSIAENIALGVEAADIDPARLRRAASLAHLAPLIDALPHGFAQLIGERGVRMSGGQAQRLGVARALYREAALLLLDEATSSLDVGVESDIMTAIESIRGSLTVVLIAHRHASLRCCDWIIELRHGRIVAQGAAHDMLRHFNPAARAAADTRRAP